MENFCLYVHEMRHPTTAVTIILLLIHSTKQCRALVEDYQCHLIVFMSVFHLCMKWNLKIKYYYHCTLVIALNSKDLAPLLRSPSPHIKTTWFVFYFFVELVILFLALLCHRVRVCVWVLWCCIQLFFSTLYYQYNQYNSDFNFGENSSVGLCWLHLGNF